MVTYFNVFNIDAASLKYAEWTRQTCTSTNIHYTLVKCTRLDLEERIIAANCNENVHGIIVYYPVFGGDRDRYLQNVVKREKDVEGLGFDCGYCLYQNIRYLFFFMII